MADETFEEALNDLIKRYRDDGTELDDIVQALELARYALQDEDNEGEGEG
jgi:hypothetical protein